MFYATYFCSHFNYLGSYTQPPLEIVSLGACLTFLLFDQEKKKPFTFLVKGKRVKIDQHDFTITPVCVGAT